MTSEPRRDERVERPADDQEDLLSPARALRESVSDTGGQRIGNNGPLANPDVSFPDAGEEDDEEDEAAAGA
jgi:hypothetical protein